MTERNFQVLDSYRNKNLMYHVLRFELPLDYFAQKSASTISVVATLVQRYDKDLHAKDVILPPNPKLIAYLEGGPGCECRIDAAYTEQYVQRGYQMLYMDQRGTGLSTPIDSRSFQQMVARADGEPEGGYVERQMEYILNFTGASIVEDLESIRKVLLGTEKLSIVGQAFGGFCSFIYLSKYPESLKEVLTTGGVPPINVPRDDVYRATYARTKERNDHYYQKYPQDVARVNAILAFLSKNRVTLPNGGNLSVERFQQLGLSFGSIGGTDNIHSIVLRFTNDIRTVGYPSYSVLSQIQRSLTFETNVLYALFQETIYCDGNDPQTQNAPWSAERLRYEQGNEAFVYTEKKSTATFFTGEMVFSSMYDDYEELKPFKQLALALATNKDWPKLYDVSTLRRTTWDKVPVVGALYFNDQYVDFDTSRKVVENAFKGQNFRIYATSEFFHGGARLNPEKVVGTLFSLLEQDVD